MVLSIYKDLNMDDELILEGKNMYARIQKNVNPLVHTCESQLNSRLTLTCIMKKNLMKRSNLGWMLGVCSCHAYI